MSTDKTTATQSGWCELHEQHVLSFRGSATRDFLGRQLTCDIAELRPDNAVFGAWLTVKGRIITLLRLIHVDKDHVLAVLPASASDVLLKRMPMFVMRDDVKITHETDYKVIGAWGECVKAFNAACDTAEHAYAIQLSANVPLALCVADSSFDPFTVQPQIEASPSQRWQALNIEFGLPEVVETTREAFIPQMLNLDRINAVSFSKGCYPGQEIVARTQHLGRIKRRMYVAHTDGAVTAQPGDTIVSHDGKDIGGRVVSVAHEDGHSTLLALLPLGSDSASQAPRLHDENGAALLVSMPPYPLTDDSDSPA